jgi:predicted PurR-regulated permease PerM
MKAYPEQYRKVVFKLPFYAKITVFLIGFYLFISMLVIGQHIILPLMYAAVFAVSISPVVNLMEKKKMNRALSIIVVMSVSFIIIGLLFLLISSQASLLSDAWPALTVKLKELLNAFILWASNYTNIDARVMNEWVEAGKTEILNNRTAVLGLTLSTLGGVVTAGFLTPVYVFMILYYQPHLVEFIFRVFGSGNNNKVTDILKNTKQIIQSYLAGLFTEFIIIIVLNSIGLLMLGIDYAILLGILGALLNVIPYIGGIICVIIFIITALVTKPLIYVLYVVVLYSIIQFIDNHYIIPKIIGSKVRLNAFVSLIAVIAGDAIWGIPGMFLSIPLLAVIKLIFDRVSSLKSWGFLLGDVGSPVQSKARYPGKVLVKQVENEE